MSVDVVTGTTIARPRTEVAAYAADPGNAPAWYANINSIEWRTDPPLRIGSRMDFVAHFLGRVLCYTYEVVDYAPGERLVMQTSQGPFPMQTTYEWRDAGDGATRMILRNTGEPAGFSRLVVPIMALAMRSANRKDLARLKAILEAENDKTNV